MSNEKKFKVEYQMFRWGPLLVKTKIPESIRLKFLSEAKASTENFEQKLAGVINKEVGFRDKTIFLPFFNQMFNLESFEDAYFVQDALQSVWAHKGEVVGFKLALTSKVMQEMFGVNTSFKGNLFSRTILKGDQIISLKNYGRLGVEFELAIEIGEDFDSNSNNLTVEECMRKVSAVYPAFELIDDRNADYPTVDLISQTADNSWNANTILGTRSQNFSHLDFSINEVFKSINGNIERSVTGVALENPFNAVIWIANFLNRRGSELKKGQIVDVFLKGGI